MKHGFVYVLIDSTKDQFRYVGSTVNPISRLSNHCAGIGNCFDTILLAYMGDEHAAREAEKFLILALHPCQNKAFTKNCVIENLDSTYNDIKSANFVQFSRHDFLQDHTVCYDTFMSNSTNHALPKSRRIA